MKLEEALEESLQRHARTSTFGPPPEISHKTIKGRQWQMWLTPVGVSALIVCLLLGVVGQGAPNQGQQLATKPAVEPSLDGPAFASVDSGWLARRSADGRWMAQMPPGWVLINGEACETRGLVFAILQRTADGCRQAPSPSEPAVWLLEMSGRSGHASETSIASNERPVSGTVRTFSRDGKDYRVEVYGVQEPDRTSVEHIVNSISSVGQIMSTSTTPFISDPRSGESIRQQLESDSSVTVEWPDLLPETFQGSALDFSADMTTAYATATFTEFTAPSYRSIEICSGVTNATGVMCGLRLASASSSIPMSGREWKCSTTLKGLMCVAQSNVLGQYVAFRVTAGTFTAYEIGSILGSLDTDVSDSIWARP